WLIGHRGKGGASLLAGGGFGQERRNRVSFTIDEGAAAEGAVRVEQQGLVDRFAVFVGSDRLGEALGGNPHDDDALGHSLAPGGDRELPADEGGRLVTVGRIGRKA